MAKESQIASKKSLDRKERECSKCMDTLNAIFTTETRVSKLLSAMNAQISTNTVTGEVGIQIEDPHDEKIHFSKTESLINRVGKHGNKLKSVLPSLAVATSARTDQEPALEARSPHSSSTFSQPPPVQIQCTWCGNVGAEGGARAYVKGPDPLSIVLCANRLSSTEEVQEVLVHELIHVYDVKFHNLDLRNCTELAYSEIRAAREAECRNTSSLFRNLCIKSKATTATSNMFPKKGKECVNQMFDIALKDLHPFSSNDNRRESKSGKMYRNSESDVSGSNFPSKR